MDCMNCGGTHDVLEFNFARKNRPNEKLVLCADCRYKLATGQINRGQIGRPSLGITKKVSVTLPKADWTWVDKKAKGNRSQFFRYVIGKERISADVWNNDACLGYAILGAQKLGMNDEQIKQLVRAIYSEFDTKTVSEAERYYNKSQY